VDILKPQERQRKVGLIRSTFQQLASRLRERRDDLEAIVISGDVTVQNDARGFSLLDGVLSELKDKRPANNRVVVVPGNHDVAWEKSFFELQTAEERYANFRRYIYDAGFVTPLLDEIDFDEATDPSSLPLERHLVVGEDHRWIVIPVNSSHFCGRALRLNDSTRRAWEEAADKLGISTVDLGKRLGTPLSYDIARVQPQQLGLISKMAALALGNVASPDGAAPLKIVVLHHHLQPVTSFEEFKPFESLSNLGNVREFLRTHEIDLVLHGHKHAGCVYWDHIYPCNDDSPHRAHPVLVVAAPAPVTTPGQPLLRLIRLDDNPRTRTLAIATVPSVEYSARIEDPEEVRIQLWRPGQGADTQGIVLIESDSFDTTYARLHSLFEGRPPSAYLYNVVCRTGNPIGESRAPQGYPAVPDAESLEEWFKEMVDWWQQPSSRLDNAGYFTHGSRITRYGTESVDQLDHAIRAIRGDIRSSRGIITLLTPTLAPPRQGAFPSFCQLHLFVRDGGDQGKFLEAVAYFRKQEMRYWWAINMAEVMRLQHHAFERLNLPDIRLGPVTTISAVALWSAVPPRVVIPKVDRLLDQDIHALWLLGAALFWPQMPGRTDAERLWNQVLDGLEPPDRWNEDGVPVATGGLDYLIEAIRKLLREETGTRPSRVLSLLEQIRSANRAYQAAGENQERQHNDWRDQVRGLVQQIRLEVTALWQEPIDT